MDRRDFLRRLAFTATLPFAWQPADGFDAAVERTTAPAGTGLAPPLDADERSLVDALAEGILPATDTPGAREAGVPEFIAFLFSDWMLREEQLEFREGLRALGADAVTRAGRPFTRCTTEEQLSLLETWDREAFAAPRGAPTPFFLKLKRLVVVGYYTSETGQNVELSVQFGAGETGPLGPFHPPPPFRI